MAEEVLAFTINQSEDALSTDISWADNTETMGAEGLISSTDQSGHTLSAKDVAWADSCIDKDPDTSNVDWSLLADALLDFLTVHPEPSERSAFVQNNGFCEEFDTEMLSSNDMVGGPEIKLLPSSKEEAAAIAVSSGPGGSDIEMLSSNGMIEGTENQLLSSSDEEASAVAVTSDEDTGISLAESFKKRFLLIEDDFPPACIESQKETEEGETEFDLVSSAFENDTSTSDIFRVWDLNTPAEEEEDEFAKQLKKAFETAAPSTNDDSEALKDLKVESVDDLIYGLADLSLSNEVE